MTQLQLAGAGTTLAWGCADGSCTVFRGGDQPREAVKLPPRGHAVTAMAFSRAGDELFLGHADGSLRLARLSLSGDQAVLNLVDNDGKDLQRESVACIAAHEHLDRFAVAVGR